MYVCIYIYICVCVCVCVCLCVYFGDEMVTSEHKWRETENEHIRISNETHFKIWTRIWQATTKEMSRLLATEMESSRSAGVVGWTELKKQTIREVMSLEQSHIL